MNIQRIIRAFFSGLFTACTITMGFLWVMFAISSILHGRDLEAVGREIITFTLCIIAWWLTRRFEQLVEDRYHWKREYNELVERIYKGYFNQKESDKPMFNVGDWIINKMDKSFDLIIGYDHGYYSGEHLGFPKQYECHFRLWELGDAKPGNVLYDKSIGQIILFKGFENDMIRVFCDYSDDKRNPLCVYEDNEYYGKTYQGKNICPANEAQRKLIFDEMEKLGYELIPDDDDGVLHLVRTKDKEEE